MGNEQSQKSKTTESDTNIVKSIQSAKDININVANEEVPFYSASNDENMKVIRHLPVQPSGTDMRRERLYSSGTLHKMKVLIRGAQGTGKTSLFNRLQGKSIPIDHTKSTEQQKATITWSLPSINNEIALLEIWDLPDNANTGNLHDSTRNLGSDSNDDDLRCTTANNIHEEAQVVILLLDVSNFASLEYIFNVLPQIPSHITTLVLGNFRDLGTKRQVFKEDIERVLYNRGMESVSTIASVPRRPDNLIYFECCLLNCYGLHTLYHYFALPFLQHKAETLRGALLLVEKELAHVRCDLDSRISQQRYSEYIADLQKIRGETKSSFSADSGKEQTHEQLHQTCSNVEIAELSKAVACNGDEEAKEIPLHDIKSGETEQESTLRAVPSDLEIAGPEVQVSHNPSKSCGEDNNDVSIMQNSSLAKAILGKASVFKDQKGSKDSASVPFVRLEDFQVPKNRNSDLDAFYSDDENDYAGSEVDRDIVISPKKSRNSYLPMPRKQAFLDSDESSNED